MPKETLSFGLDQPLLPPCHKILVGKRLKLNPTYCKISKMKFPRKLLPVFIFLLSSLSIIRLIKFMLVVPSHSSTLAAQPPSFRHTNSSAPNNPASHFLNMYRSKQQSSRSHKALTEKEMRFISGVISRRVPCNLLIFGIEREFLSLKSMNKGGNTIFLEENPENIDTVKINSSNAKIYKVKYTTSAANAFNLLKYARKNQACKPDHRLLKDSTCKLAMTNLPSEVLSTEWDIIVVDGPSGHKPDAPGRMAAMYTASILARNTENLTDVVVHDVDRMIEKWYSWEFLCDENLTSSKGKLWNFSIRKNSNLRKFCTARK